MTAPRDLLTLPEVAALLRMTPEVFYKRRTKLRDAGFPEPVPGCGYRWDPRAVASWQDRHLAPEPAPAPIADPEADLEAEREELRKRLGNVVNLMGGKRAGSRR